jgi:integrase
MPAEIAESLRADTEQQKGGDGGCRREAPRTLHVRPPRIDRWGEREVRALTPQAVNLILKQRFALAGLDPKEFSAHGLRAGYQTESARRGVALPEAMQQSQHRSAQQAASYYNDAERQLGKAARLV